MRPTSIVTVTLEGVRDEFLPRLQTLLKTHLSRHGRAMKVKVDPEKPSKKKEK